MYVLRPLFTKFQKELVAYANTQAGKDKISQFGGKELKENYPVVKVAPDGIHQKIGKNLYRAVFYPRSPYVKLFAEALTYCEIAEANKYKVEDKLKEFVIPHYLGETSRLKSVLPAIYLDSGTFYPDAHPESTSVDGYAARGNGVDEVWSTIRAGAGTDSLDSGANLDYFYRAGTAPDKWTDIRRVIMLFDTSSLGSGSIVSAGTLSVYQHDFWENSMGGGVSLVNSSPASNTAIVNGDYGNVGTTQQAADIAMTSFNTTGYINFSLNATGIANVAVAGVSKYGSRFSNDQSGSAPTHPGAVSPRNQLYWYSADNGSNKPKLVVTYTRPVTAVGYTYFM